eukprot:1159445-Pelagomonas_calceolata.AAC.14
MGEFMTTAACVPIDAQEYPCFALQPSEQGIAIEDHIDHIEDRIDHIEDQSPQRMSIRNGRLSGSPCGSCRRSDPEPHLLLSSPPSIVRSASIVKSSCRRSKPEPHHPLSSPPPIVKTSCRRNTPKSHNCQVHLLLRRADLLPHECCSARVTK